MKPLRFRWRYLINLVFILNIAAITMLGTYVFQHREVANEGCDLPALHGIKNINLVIDGYSRPAAYALGERPTYFGHGGQRLTEESKQKIFNAFKSSIMHEISYRPGCKYPEIRNMNESYYGIAIDGSDEGDTISFHIYAIFVGDITTITVTAHRANIGKYGLWRYFSSNRYQTEILSGVKTFIFDSETPITAQNLSKYFWRGYVLTGPHVSEPRDMAQ